VSDDTTVVGRITDKFMFDIQGRMVARKTPLLSTDQHNRVYEAMYDFVKRITTKEPDELDFDAQLDDLRTEIARLTRERDAMKPVVDAARDVANDKDPDGTTMYKLVDALDALEKEQGKK
jgi:hypothetical protein